MDEVGSPVREYRVGKKTTIVRFMESDEVLADIPEAGGRLWIFDTNTRPIFEGNISSGVVLPSGEQHKGWESVSAILRGALDAGIGRDGVLVGFGGGVVCDVTAFAASIYMRGCRVILVPTTLLAMVDAAFGGKTGIDFDGYKNMVGTFHPATEIRIAVAHLRTLSFRDFRSGLAEVLKHALLQRSALRELLAKRRQAVMERDTKLLRTVIDEALAVKANIIERDFRESELRTHLNLGHTFGHALETATGFTAYTHGEAVAWGIDKAMRLGVRLGVTDPQYAREVTAMLEAYGFDLRNLPEKARKILEATRKDKKKRGGTVRHVLQRTWGDTLMSEADDESVLSVLREADFSRSAG